MKIKPIPAATAWGESIKWNLSGSTLIHIIILLGVGFYVSDSVPQNNNLAIKVQLNSDAKAGDDEAETEEETAAAEQAETSDSPSEDTAEAQPLSTFEVVKTLHSPLSGVNEKLQDLSTQQFALLKDLRESQQAIEDTPREVFTTSSYSSDSEFDDYKETWRKHVETYGNDNYPPQISGQNLTGSLVLDAVIRADGTLVEVNVLVSSENAVMDQAAIDIVRAAAPYPEVPANAEQNGRLHIIRTWRFEHNSVSSTL